MSEPETQRPLGLDPSEIIPVQNGAALMRLDQAHLLVFDWPVEIPHPVKVDALRTVLGADAELPTEDGTYYYVTIKNAAGEIVPMLIPEADVRPMAVMAAVLHSMEQAERVTYRRGMFPVGALLPKDQPAGQA